MVHGEHGEEQTDPALAEGYQEDADWHGDYYDKDGYRYGTTTCILTHTHTRIVHTHLYLHVRTHAHTQKHNHTHTR